MAKMIDKKELTTLVRKEIQEVLSDMEKRYQTSLSDEAKAALANDKIREEVFCRVQEWVQEDVKKQMDMVTKEVSLQISELKKIIRKSEKHFDTYQVDIKWLKKSLKDLEKRVSELEKHDKQERQIFTRIAVNAGVVAPGASFKEVRKVYKKCTPKARYARVPDRRNQLDDKNIIDM